MEKRIEQKETPSTGLRAGERNGEKEERILTQSRKDAKGRVSPGRPGNEGQRMGNESVGLNLCNLKCEVH